MILKSIYFYVFTLLTGTSVVLAQGTIHQEDPSKHLFEGIEAFENGKYAWSIAKINMHEELNGASEVSSYYHALSSVELNSEKGKRELEEFVLNYPNSSFALKAHLQLANTYFEEELFDQAAHAFSAYSRTYTLSDEEQFRLGYSLLQIEELDSAANVLDQIDVLSSYYYGGAYYAGMVFLDQEEYEMAEEKLSAAQKSSAYEVLAITPLAKVYYELKWFNKLNELIAKSVNNPEVDAQIFLFAAEINFQNADYEEAAKFYQQYANQQKPSAEVRYKTGYALWKVDNLADAEENFKIAVLSKDSISQYSAYYLGMIYLKDNNLNYAYSSFQKASQLRYSQPIRKQSLLNCAKVAFDLNKYDEALQLFDQYRMEYGEEEGLNNFITQCYLLNTDYEKAIIYMESLQTKSSIIRSAYQIATFEQAVLEYNNRSFGKSLTLFRKALIYKVDQMLVGKTYLYTGELHSMVGKYPEAIRSYQSALQSTNDDSYIQKIRYGLGFAFYNSRQYQEAKEQFQLIHEDFPESATVLTRKADAHFALKEFDSAIKSYEESREAGYLNRGYLKYQIGICNYFANRPEEAKQEFLAFQSTLSDSEYADDAVYQLGLISIEHGEYVLAEQYFSDLIDNHPESSLLPKAILKRSVAQGNNKKYEAAANGYRLVLEQYASATISQSALLGLQEMLVKLGREEEFSIALQSFKNKSSDSKYIESLEFDQGKKLYYAQKYKESIDALNNYLAAYDVPKHREEAIYLIGESSYRLNQYVEALESYYDIVDRPNEFTNRVISRVAELEYRLKDFKKSIAFYRRLEASARNRKETLVAYQGLMRAFYAQENIDSARTYADYLVDGERVPTYLQIEGHFYKGKVLWQLKELEEAQDNLLIVMNKSKGEIAVESYYIAAHIHYQKQSYKQSIQLLFELNDSFSEFEYWVTKSFILIAQNYEAMGEYFQAEATLQSVVDNSSVMELVDEARFKLEQLDSKAKSIVGKDSLDNGK